MGGLGNQLFQIFATIFYSFQTNNQPYFCFLRNPDLGNRMTAWNTLFVGLNHWLVDALPANRIVLHEKEFAYNPIPIIRNQAIEIFGYFQSEKYFKPYFNNICNLIGIEARRKELVAKLNQINDPITALETTTTTTKTISLHFRLGDYVKIQQYHPLLTVRYYLNALTYIQSKSVGPRQVIYFCEDSDIVMVDHIVEELKKQFPNYVFIRCNPQLADWEQMLYMSLCHDHIIANSSYSWWGAYLNPSEDKIVCYPNIWFGPAMATHNVRDLCPDSWIKIMAD